MLTKSKQPRKQRLARATAPLHARQKLMAAHIGKELREKLKTRRRSLPVREGDRVRVVRGEFRKHQGRVSRVDLSEGKIFIEGIVVRKAKGQEVLVPVEPSNVVLVEADMRDKRRAAMLARSGKAELEKVGGKVGGTKT